MQNANASDVAQALYNYLDDVYNQKQNFLFYVAKDFNRRNSVKFGYLASGGLQGNIVNGVWTVYWAATPIRPEHDVQLLNVDHGNISNTLTTLNTLVPVNSNTVPYDATFVYNNIITTSAFSGRKTSLMIVVLYFFDPRTLGSPASVGSPPRLNAYYNRFLLPWPTRSGGYSANVMQVVDIIVQ